MAISMDLRVLARKLEKSSDDLLINASTKSPDVFHKVATAVAAASTLLEGVADDMDQNASFEITPKQLDEIAALASAFDESEDPLLKKQASVLDELLLSIASPKNALALSRKVTEDEINRLRSERRKARGEEAYDEPRQVLSEMENAKAQAKAVEQQVKRYIPMEAPLSTRYPPDRPGGQMARISDNVYQDIVTGIIYDYKAGYKTQKGNEVPGSSVEEQTRAINDNRDQGTSLFETRESLMGRYASDEQVVKIASVLKAVRDYSPKLLNSAIDAAMESGLSTSQVATILASDISAQGFKVIAEEDFENVSAISPTLDAPTIPLSSDDDKKKIELEDDDYASEVEYKNLRNILIPLTEVIAADPTHSDTWRRLVGYYIGKSSGVGVNAYHRDLLYREFKEFIPAKSPKIDEVVAHQSLMGLVINAVQELAPHLLKSTIAKAQAEGLDDSQIKSVLSSDFSNQVKKSFDEIKVAESIFPHLQDLGWNDLIDQHLKAMATLGVSKGDIEKIASQYQSEDRSSLNLLGKILKAAAVPASKNPNPATLETPIQVINPLGDDDEEEDQDEEGADQARAALHVIEIIRGKLVDPDEYLTLKRTWHGRELIAAAVHYEMNLLKHLLNREKYSELYNMVQEWALAKLSKEPIMAAPAKEIIPEKVPVKSQPVEELPKVEEVDINSKEYKVLLKKVTAEAEEEVKEFCKEEKPRKILAEIYLAEKARAEKKYETFDFDQSKTKEIIDEIVARIIKRKLAGATSPTNYEILEVILAENRKVEHGSFNPKAQGPTNSKDQLHQAKGESDANFEERQRKNRLAPVTKKQLEIASKKSVDVSKLSDEIPAKNSTQPGLGYLRWETYQANTGEDVSELQAHQLEQKIIEKRNSDLLELELIYKNFPYKNESAPAFINELPDAIRSNLIDQMKKGESAFAIVKYLDAKKKDEKLEFVLPSLSELRDAILFYTSGGALKREAIKNFHTDMISRINRRTANSVLEEAGLMPMFNQKDGDNISVIDIRKYLQELMGETRASEPFIKTIPTDAQGNRLTPFWEDPVSYTNALGVARSHFENPFANKWSDDNQIPQEIRDQQDDYMVEKGFVSPSDKLFGRTNTRQMLRGTKVILESGQTKDIKGNILSDFTKPGTTEQYKTLFSHPEEYTKAFWDTKTRAEFREKPREWLEIMGVDGPALADIPRTIKEKIWPMILKGEKLNNIVDKASALGISADIVGRMVNYSQESGNKIRGTIQHLILKDEPASLEEIQAELDKRFPGANVPRATIEYVYGSILADKEDTQENKNKQDEAMEAMGYYPPNKLAVGSKVTFADIISPRRRGRGGFVPVSAEPLAELQKNPPTRSTVKTKTKAPAGASTQRQPGSKPIDVSGVSSTELDRRMQSRTKGLSSLLDKEPTYQGKLQEGNKLNREQRLQALQEQAKKKQTD